MEKFFIKVPEVRVAADMMTMFADRPLNTRPYRSKVDPTLLIGELYDEEVTALERMEARLYRDIKFEIVTPSSEMSIPSVKEYWRLSEKVSELSSPQKSLDDVLEHINAPEAWETTQGGGVTIAIIDTGICQTLREFPAYKQSPLDLPTAFQGMHWQDVRGHGSMCATIAAGTKSNGGRFNGVAPDATVISARTTLWSTDIYNIYDELIAARRNGTIYGPLVISNSYASYVCSPPDTLPEDHPYLSIVLEAIDDGITVVFAAGNNHYDVLCNNDPTQCSPTSIWGVNSHERVLSVGTVNENNSNQDSSTPHANSSRGPGQWSGALPKPDCVAPTYGRVVWGCNYRVMDWWGTSGACPQVAGLAALMLSVNPNLQPNEVGNIIRNTCRDIGASHNCVGHGLIDCAAAVALASTTL